MNRQYYLNLAANGLRMPIASDIILHEYPDPNNILTDGQRLGKILEETAHRYHTPLAVAHMDLELDKQVLLQKLGIPKQDILKFHFEHFTDKVLLTVLNEHLTDPFPAQMQAHIESIRYIAEQTELTPIGMSIGPFSLMTKLLTDPITPIAMAGAGISAEDDEEVELVEQALQLAIRIILHSIDVQINAGAQAIFIAEPAANKVFLSPNQIEAGSNIFERYVMQYNRQISYFLNKRGAELIFHCCGEITDYMLQKFTELHPVILSLGSSRNLWQDAALVPKDIVLYGNLPSKRFYSDDLISLSEVKRTGDELIQKMKAVGHPFILGSECDILSVPGCEETIRQKACAIVGEQKVVPCS